jgi:DnaK suppressor protein
MKKKMSKKRIIKIKKSVKKSTKGKTRVNKKIGKAKKTGGRKIKVEKKRPKKSNFRSLPAFEYKVESLPSASQKSCHTKKRKIVFTSKELAGFKTSLEKTKAEVLKRIQKKKDLDMPQAEVGDPVDQALQSLDKEFLFEITDIELMMIDQIEAALRRIEKGVFGKCQSCECFISKKRLHALPFARFCINCQSTNEFSGGGRGE